MSDFTGNHQGRGEGGILGATGRIAAAAAVLASSCHFLRVANCSAAIRVCLSEASVFSTSIPPSVSVTLAMSLICCLDKPRKFNLILVACLGCSSVVVA